MLRTKQMLLFRFVLSCFVLFCSFVLFFGLLVFFSKHDISRCIRHTTAKITASVSQPGKTNTASEFDFILLLARFKKKRLL